MKFLERAEPPPSWHIVAKESDLRAGAPRRVFFSGQPIVLFRDSRGVVALADLCPHRGAPLSEGRLVDEAVSCPYHGWRFGRDGQCHAIPGLENQALCKRFRAQAYRCCVHQGFVWLNTEQNSSEGPPNIPGWSEPGYSRVIWHSELETDLQSAAENFLDATHTHFVHAGLIRTEGKRRRVLATTRSVDGGVEAEYEEGQQAGWIMRLLAGGCGKIESFGRFVLPGLAQLEYRTETGHHAYISAFLAPSQPGHIQAHVVFTFKWGHICRWLCPLIAPLFRLALRQDMRILRLQREAQRYWPEFNGLSSPLDLLGPKIEALLRASAAGRALPHWNEKQTELFL